MKLALKNLGSSILQALKRIEKILFRIMPIVVTLFAEWAMLTNLSAEMFQRAGSIVVAVSIVILAWAVRRMQGQEQELQTLGVRARIAGGRRAEEEGMVDEIDGLRSDIQTVRVWLIRNEVAILVLGTLQWGYGDLFHRWWHGI